MSERRLDLDAIERWVNAVGLDTEGDTFVDDDKVLALVARVRELEAAMSKIDAIRNAIIGTQRVNWSAHVYPLVAALEEAGYRGQSYELARLQAEKRLMLERVSPTPRYDEAEEVEALGGVAAEHRCDTAGGVARSKKLKMALEAARCKLLRIRSYDSEPSYEVMDKIAAALVLQPCLRGDEVRTREAPPSRQRARWRRATGAAMMTDLDTIEALAEKDQLDHRQVDVDLSARRQGNANLLALVARVRDLEARRAVADRTVSEIHSVAILLETACSDVLGCLPRELTSASRAAMERARVLLRALEELIE